MLKNKGPLKKKPLKKPPSSNKIRKRTPALKKRKVRFGSTAAVAGAEEILNPLPGAAAASAPPVVTPLPPSTAAGAAAGAATKGVVISFEDWKVVQERFVYVYLANILIAGVTLILLGLEVFTAWKWGEGIPEWVFWVMSLAHFILACVISVQSVELPVVEIVTY